MATIKKIQVGSTTYDIEDPRAAHGVAYRPVAHYGTTASNPTTGWYQISINSTTTWMLAFTIRIYQGYTWNDVVISGYQYGNNYWYSPKATIFGESASMTVKFGYTSATNLWVAVPSGNYTGLDIINVTNGYTQIADSTLENLFTITYVTTLTGTTQSTVTAYPKYAIRGSATGGATPAADSQGAHTHTVSVNTYAASTTNIKATASGTAVGADGTATCLTGVKASGTTNCNTNAYKASVSGTTLELVAAGTTSVVTGVAANGTATALTGVKVTTQPTIALATGASAGTGVINVATGITSGTASATTDNKGAHTHTVTGTVSQPTFSGTGVQLVFGGTKATITSTGSIASSGAHAHAVTYTSTAVSGSASAAVSNHTHTMAHTHTVTVPNCNSWFRNN